MARLLLVDDDPDILDILSDYLQSVGHEVLLAQSGAEVQTLLSTHSITAAVVDWSIPDLPGSGLVALVRRLAPGCPILVTTGHLRDVVPAELPVNGVLRKPFSLKALALRIEALPLKAAP